MEHRPARLGGRGGGGKVSFQVLLENVVEMQEGLDRHAIRPTSLIAELSKHAFDLLPSADDILLALLGPAVEFGLVEFIPFLVGERKIQEGRGGKLLFLALLPTRAPFAALLHQLIKAWGTHYRFSLHGWPLKLSLLISGTVSSFLNWPKTTHRAGFRVASFSLIAQGLFRDSVVWTDAGQAFSQIESETSFSSQARFLEASPGPVWNASHGMGAHPPHTITRFHAKLQCLSVVFTTYGRTYGHPNGGSRNHGHELISPRPKS